MNKIIKRTGIIALASYLALAVPISAFAEYNISNSNYYGTYYLDGDTNSPSYINVNETRILLNAYYINGKKCYVRGSSREGYLTSSKFSASYSRISKCDASGVFLGENDYLANVMVTGDVSIEGSLFHPLDKIHITSDDNDGVFTFD